MSTHGFIKYDQIQYTEYGRIGNYKNVSHSCKITIQNASLPNLTIIINTYHHYCQKVNNRYSNLLPSTSMISSVSGMDKKLISSIIF